MLLVHQVGPYPRSVFLDHPLSLKDFLKTYSSTRTELEYDFYCSFIPSPTLVLKYLIFQKSGPVWSTTFLILRTSPPYRFFRSRATVYGIMPNNPNPLRLLCCTRKRFYGRLHQFSHLRINNKISKHRNIPKILGIQPSYSLKTF